MRVLLINRNDFVDGGADRVFLNTYELLSGASKAVKQKRILALKHLPVAPVFKPGNRAGTPFFNLSRPLKALTSDDCGIFPTPGLKTGATGKGSDSRGPISRNLILSPHRRASGHVQVATFTRKDAGLILEDPRLLSGYKKIRLVRNYLYNLNVARALEQKIREFRPDVAHIHLFYGTLSGSVLRVLRKHKVPVVHTVHDYRLICPANAMLDRHGNICEQCQGKHFYKAFALRCSDGNLFFSAVIMLEAYLRKWFIRPLKLINRFIFVSEFSRMKHTGFVPEYGAKSQVLYNTTEAGEKGVRGDYFLYFGRLSKEKGLLTLIEAAQLAGIKLVIAGRGPQEEELGRLRDLETKRPRDGETTHNPQLTTHNPQPTTYNLQPTTFNISFPGFRSGAELTSLIRKCSFVVVPSEWYENNPMSVVEAFALGKPVIGARIGGIPELVGEGTGFLFKSGNAGDLAAVLTAAEGISETEYQRLSENCITFARNHFSRERHLTTLLQTYREAIG